MRPSPGVVARRAQVVVPLRDGLVALARDRHDPARVALHARVRVPRVRRRRERRRRVASAAGASAAGASAAGASVGGPPPGVLANDPPASSASMSTSARVNAATCAVMTAAGSYGARSNVTVRLSPPPPAAASASAGSGRRTTRGAPSGPIVTSNDIDDPSVIAAIDSGVMPAACAAAIAAAASPPPPISFKMPPTMALICAPPSADVGSDTLPSCTLLPAGMRMKSPAAAARCVAAAWSMSSLRASPTTSGGRETRRSVSPSSTRRSDSRCVSLRTRPRQMRRWRADGTPARGLDRGLQRRDFDLGRAARGGGFTGSGGDGRRGSDREREGRSSSTTTTLEGNGRKEKRREDARTHVARDRQGVLPLRLLLPDADADLPRLPAGTSRRRPSRPSAAWTRGQPPPARRRGRVLEKRAADAATTAGRADATPRARSRRARDASAMPRRSATRSRGRSRARKARATRDSARRAVRSVDASRKPTPRLPRTTTRAENLSDLLVRMRMRGFFRARLRFKLQVRPRWPYHALSRRPARAARPSPHPHLRPLNRAASTSVSSRSSASRFFSVIGNSCPRGAPGR